MRRTRSYTKEFIEDAILLSETTGKNQTELSQSLGIPVTTLRQWILNYKSKGKSAFDNIPDLTPDQAELSRLRKELSDVTMERDILKKAVGIFSKTQK